MKVTNIAGQRFGRLIALSRHDSNTKSGQALWACRCDCGKEVVKPGFLLGAAPTKQHSLDRIDVNGNYEPGNCRWATPREQSLNTRRNVLITIGRETKPMIEWAREMGIDHKKVHARLKSGYSAEDALSNINLKKVRRPRIRRYMGGIR